MPTCAAGFNSCRFKDEAGAWAPNCARCGRLSWDARWKLTPEAYAAVNSSVAPRPPRSTTQPTLWPIGTRFVYVIDGRRIYGWIVTKYTKTRMFFYKPEYDGDKLYMRRIRLDEVATNRKRGRMIRDGQPVTRQEQAG